MMNPGDGVARVGESHLVEPFTGIRRLEHAAVLGDSTEAGHDTGPDLQPLVVRDGGQLVAAEGPHLLAGKYREHRLGRDGAELENRRHGRSEIGSGGGMVVTRIVPADPAVPEQLLDGEEVEDLRGVPGNESDSRVGVNSCRSESDPPLAERQTPAVAGSEGREVTGHTGDVFVAAQQLVEREGLAQPDQRGTYLRRLVQRGDAASRGQQPDFGSEGMGFRIGS